MNQTTGDERAEGLRGVNGAKELGAKQCHRKLRDKQARDYAPTRRRAGAAQSLAWALRVTAKFVGGHDYLSHILGAL